MHHDTISRSLNCAITWLGYLEWVRFLLVGLQSTDWRPAFLPRDLLAQVSRVDSPEVVWVPERDLVRQCLWYSV